MTGRSLLFLCTSLLWAGTFAGCTEPTAEETAPVLGPALSEFAGCPWAYPDGTPVDCAALPTRIGFAPAPPEHGVCIGHDTQHGWKAYWDPQTDERGVWLDLGLNGTFDGVLTLKTGGETYLYEWRDGPTRGYLGLEAAYGENFTFRLMLYNTTYLFRSPSGDSIDGDEIWSQYDERYWVVHRLETPNGTYTFQDMERLDVVRRTPEGDENVTFWDPHSFVLDGADFSLTVLWSFEHGVPALNRIPSSGLDRGCLLAS